METIRATLTKTYRGEPLAVIDDLPGGGAAMTPTQLRCLAYALNRIADDCEARAAAPARKRSLPLPSHRREYRLTKEPLRPLSSAWATPGK